VGRQAEEQLDPALRQAFERHEILQHGAQRVPIAGIELIGRQDARPEFGGHSEQTARHAPAMLRRQRESWVKAEVRQAAPEIVEQLSGVIPAAAAQSGRQQRRVDGAGAGPHDRRHIERLLLEQAIERAPGEGAMRAASLKRDIHAERWRRRIVRAARSHRGLRAGFTGHCRAGRRTDRA
jgi:hypothetical protein